MSAPSQNLIPEPGPDATPLSTALLHRVLQPYQPNARYVHRATMVGRGCGITPRLHAPDSWLRVSGECGFAAPCYIEATGHFNAVEANITFNQLLYLGMAETVRARLLPELRHWTLDDFFRAQLPDVLIADYHARFRAPMGSRAYRGSFTFIEVVARPDRRQLRLQTRAEFRDDHGGECTIDASIALVNWQPA